MFVFPLTPTDGESRAPATDDGVPAPARVTPPEIRIGNPLYVSARELEKQVWLVFESMVWLITYTNSRTADTVVNYGIV